MTSIHTIGLPSGTQTASDRELAVLRALGRLGAVESMVLHALIFPGAHQTTADRAIARLLERGFIWMTRGPARPTTRADGRPGPPRSQRVFGLTVDGKALLETLGAEAAGVTPDRMLVRDRRAPPPSVLTLLGDLLISAWCAAVLDQARRAPMLVGARCQTKLVTALDPQSKNPLQTVGAYLELIFDPQRRTYERPGWQVPWFDEATPKNCRVVRFVLEVDTGRQAIPTLLLQAQTYAALQKADIYTKLLGGMPLPVIVTLPGQRAGQVIQAWRDGWPNTPAVIASTAKAEHAEYGALWGTYSTIKDTPPQPVFLLSGLVQNPETWGQITQGWKP